MTRIRCRHEGRCGGCQDLSLPYDEQIAAKQEAMRALFSGFRGCEVLPILPSPRSEGYRHKVQLPFGASPDRSRLPLLGCYAEGSHAVVDQEECFVQDPALTRAAHAVREWARRGRIPVYDERTGSGFLRHVLLRKGLATGEILVGLVANGRRPPHYRTLLKPLLQALSKALPGEDGHLVGIVQDVNTRDTNVVLGGLEEPWWGRSWLKELIGSHSYHVELSTFFQVNPYQTPRLYQAAAERIPEGGKVLDAYCGMGTIALWLSGRSREVVGVEENPASVEAARRAAKANGVSNVRFQRADASEALPRLVGEGFDSVVVDPPRKGLGEGALEALAGCRARRIVYVSCDPSSLARDARALAPGWRLVSVQPVDMFPHTRHVENVALLEPI